MFYYTVTNQQIVLKYIVFFIVDKMSHGP